MNKIIYLWIIFSFLFLITVIIFIPNEHKENICLEITKQGIESDFCNRLGYKKIGVKK